MAQRRGYAPVPTDEDAATARASAVAAEEAEAAARSSKRRKREAKAAAAAARKQLVSRISAKLHAVFWVLLAAFVAARTDLFVVLFSDERVSRFWLDVALLCAGVNACLGLYLTVYLPYIAKITLSWGVYCPRVIPTITGVGCALLLSLVCALWHVFGLLTIPVVFVMFMGFTFLLFLIPTP